MSTDWVAQLRFRTALGSALPIALAGVSVIVFVVALVDRVWTNPWSLVISVVFILAVLGLAAWLKLINDRMAILVSPDAFLLQGVQNEITTLASRSAVAQIVVTGKNLQLVDAHGRDLYKTDRSAWSDKQVEAFGQAVGVPVIRV